MGMVMMPKKGLPRDGAILCVEEVSRRIDGLPAEQLKKVREFEKQNKNRETLIEQIDRKIRANNS